MNEQLLTDVDWLFRQTARKFVKERDKVTVEGLTLPAIQILNKIIADGQPRLVDLAEALNFTSGAITAQCDKLEKRHFVERIRDTADRRTIRLAITEEGRAFIQKYEQLTVMTKEILFKGFTEEELTQQIAFYTRIIDNLQHFSPTLLALVDEQQ